MITRFGTASAMVVQELTEENIPVFMAIDNRGLYLTYKKYLDKNLSDPNRISNRKLMEERIIALGIDYNKIYEENKHIIQDLPKEKAAKINPLKASKRSMGK